MTSRTVSAESAAHPSRPLMAGLDAASLRADFPILAQRVHERPLVYLDNAATTQKPQVVIDALTRYYSTCNSNVHRGLHYLSEQATAAFEEARLKVQRFIGASDYREVIFTRGTTEAINLVAQTYGRQTLKSGDEVLITHMEHHSNIVPWQMLCQEKGATLRVAPVDDRGQLIVEDFQKLLSPRTRIVGVVHVSNVLGTVNPVKELVDLAHRVGAVVLVDGAQAAPHMALDVRQLGCDFYTLSSHKLYGPTGIGVLWGRHELLEAMPPYQGGGDMIRSVTFEKTIYNELPYKFEAGTPAIAQAIGLGAAIDYLGQVGMDRIAAHESDLLAYGTERLLTVPGLRLIGTAGAKAGVLSFTLEGVHPHETGQALDDRGIAVRTGHHCAQPLMDRFGVPATTRASLGLYNVRQDLDALVEGLNFVREFFKP